MDENQNQGLSKKERRELRRQEKKVGETQVAQKAKLGKIWKWLIIFLAVLAVAAGIYFLTRRSDSGSPDLSQAIAILDRSHVARATPVTDYNSNPPTSGRHWSDENAPASRGVHDEELPDEVMVHNIEHGEIWISYKPNIPDDVKEELRKLARDTYKVVLTIRSADDTDIAVAAWGRLDKFNLDGKPLDIKRINDFITRYRNKGPELVP